MVNAYEFEKTAKELTAEEAEQAKGKLYTFALGCIPLFPEH